MTDKPGSESAAVLGRSTLSYVQGLAGKGQPQQKIALVGAALTLVGAFLPFYVINLPEGMGMSVSFLHAGLPGALTVLAAIVLGGIAIMPAPSRLVIVVGFGAATLVLGMLLSAYAGSSLGPASLAAGAAGIVGRGIGAYMVGVGALLLEYVYVQRVMAIV